MFHGHMGNFGVCSRVVPSAFAAANRERPQALEPVVQNHDDSRAAAVVARRRGLQRRLQSRLHSLFGFADVVICRGYVSNLRRNVRGSSGHAERHALGSLARFAFAGGTSSERVCRRCCTFRSRVSVKSTASLSGRLRARCDSDNLRCSSFARVPKVVVGLHREPHLGTRSERCLQA